MEFGSLFFPGMMLRRMVSQSGLSQNGFGQNGIRIPFLSGHDAQADGEPIWLDPK